MNVSALPNNRKSPANHNQIVSGLGLDSEDSFDLAGMLSKDSHTSPTEIALDKIHEDPNNPRQSFDGETLQELADTIALRGVKTPISLRPGTTKGNFIINHGARRFRASKLAGKTSIPAFIDRDYSEEDQVIENLQRDELNSREIANFIGRKLPNMKKGDMAKAIGKSASFVSQHLTLLDLPVPISEVFNNGRCNDVTVINEQNPEVVTQWLDDENQDITRGFIRLLKASLDHNELNDNASEDESGSVAPKSNKAKKIDNLKVKKVLIQVRHKEKDARLLLDKRSSSKKSAWIRYNDSGKEAEVPLNSLILSELLEA